MVSILMWIFIGLIVCVAVVATVIVVVRGNQTNQFGLKCVIPTVVVSTVVLATIFVIFAPIGFYTKSLISGEASSSTEFNRVENIVKSIRQDTKGGFGETEVFVEFVESKLIPRFQAELSNENAPDIPGWSPPDRIYFYSVIYEAKGISMWNRTRMLKEVLIVEELLKERLKID